MFVVKCNLFHLHLSQVRAIYRQHQSNKSDEAAGVVANGGDTANVNGSATMNGGSGNSKQGK